MTTENTTPPYVAFARRMHHDVLFQILAASLRWGRDVMIDGKTGRNLHSNQLPALVSHSGGIRIGDMRQAPRRGIRRQSSDQPQ